MKENHNGSNGSKRPQTPAGGAPHWGNKARAQLVMLHFKDATATDMRFLKALIWRANWKTGRCDPGTAQLMKDIGCGERSVHASRAYWKRKGVIDYRTRGTNQSAIYCINWPLTDRIYMEMCTNGGVEFPRDPDMVVMDEIRRHARKHNGTITPRHYDQLDDIMMNRGAKSRVDDPVSGRAYDMLQNYPITTKSSH